MNPLDARVNGEWTAVDRYIAEHLPTLRREPVLREGFCLFQAAALGLAGHGHDLIRHQVVEWLRQHGRNNDSIMAAIVESNRTFEQYVNFMSEEDAWGGDAELMVIAAVYGVTLVVIRPNSLGGAEERRYPHDGRDNKVYLAYNGRDHYDAIIMHAVFSGENAISHTAVVSAQPQLIEKPTKTEGSRKERQTLAIGTGFGEVQLASNLIIDGPLLEHNQESVSQRFFIVSYDCYVRRTSIPDSAVPNGYRVTCDDLWPVRSFSVREPSVTERGITVKQLLINRLKVPFGMDLRVRSFFSYNDWTFDRVNQQNFVLVSDWFTHLGPLVPVDQPIFVVVDLLERNFVLAPQLSSQLGWQLNNVDPISCLIKIRECFVRIGVLYPKVIPNEEKMMVDVLGQAPNASAVLVQLQNELKNLVILETHIHRWQFEIDAFKRAYGDVPVQAFPVELHPVVQEHGRHREYLIALLICFGGLWKTWVGDVFLTDARANPLNFLVSNPENHAADGILLEELRGNWVIKPMEVVLAKCLEFFGKSLRDDDYKVFLMKGVDQLNHPLFKTFRMRVSGFSSPIDRRNPSMWQVFDDNSIHIQPRKDPLDSNLGPSRQFADRTIQCVLLVVQSQDRPWVIFCASMLEQALMRIGTIVHRLDNCSMLEFERSISTFSPAPDTLYFIGHGALTGPQSMVQLGDDPQSFQRLLNLVADNLVRHSDGQALRIVGIADTCSSFDGPPPIITSMKAGVSFYIAIASTPGNLTYSGYFTLFLTSRLRGGMRLSDLLERVTHVEETFRDIRAVVNFSPCFILRHAEAEGEFMTPYNRFYYIERDRLNLLDSDDEDEI